MTRSKGWDCERSSGWDLKKDASSRPIAKQAHRLPPQMRHLDRRPRLLRPKWRDPCIGPLLAPPQNASSRPKPNRLIVCHHRCVISTEGRVFCGRSGETPVSPGQPLLSNGQLHPPSPPCQTGHPRPRKPPATPRAPGLHQQTTSALTASPPACCWPARSSAAAPPASPGRCTAPCWPWCSWCPTGCPTGPPAGTGSWCRSPCRSGRWA